MFFCNKKIFVSFFFLMCNFQQGKVLVKIKYLYLFFVEYLFACYCICEEEDSIFIPERSSDKDFLLPRHPIKQFSFFFEHSPATLVGTFVQMLINTNSYTKKSRLLDLLDQVMSIVSTQLSLEGVKQIPHLFLKKMLKLL